MTVTNAYKKLMVKAKDLAILQSVESVISWDMETMMPPRGIDLRSEQLALLSSVEHKMITEREIDSLLKEIMSPPVLENFNEIQKRNVYLIKKHHDEQTALPERLVAEIAKQEAIATDIWKKAKAAGDFSTLRPELEKLLELKKEAAEILMKVKMTSTPYDALIDIFEPKMTSENITKTFEQLQKGLTRILEKCDSSNQAPDATILKRRIPTTIQREISKAVAEFVGYDVSSREASGRIDETEHPFTNGYYDDVRITTHYYEDDFASSLFSVLHEAGHAMYDQNLNRDWIYQPVGASASMGFHESQSRLVENVIGRSHEFWTFFLPKLKNITGNLLENNLDLEGFVRAVNKVERSKIRVEADELTYGLHIIVRFDLERDLFADRIAVKELPDLWNQKYKENLDVHVTNDSEGVMQDTHWASGLFGYFPSYALGNIYSGQILEAMNKELSEWRRQIARGDFHQVKRWLRSKIHVNGDLYDPNDLIKKISGSSLDVKPYLNYLYEKYSKLYDF